MTCDNCNTELLPISHIAVSGDYRYCSTTCREMHRRSQEARDGLDKWHPLTIGQISVLSADDRETIDEARRWLRRLLLQMQPAALPGMEDGREHFTLTLEGMERDGLFDVLENLDALRGRFAQEPQLARNSDIGENGQAITPFLLWVSLAGILLVGSLAFVRGWIPQ